MERGSLQYKLLLIITAGIALGLSPKPCTHYRIYKELAQALGDNQELDEWNEEKIRQSLYRLTKSEYMHKRITNNGKDKFGIIFEITPEGKEVLEKYQIKRLIHNLRISPPVTWDGKWRFVIFDIPEKYHVARDVLREKLKRMNFFQIQQSVWVHPHPCKQEIELLAEYYFLTDKIFVFEDILTHDAKLRAYFMRKGIKL